MLVNPITYEGGVRVNPNYTAFDATATLGTKLLIGLAAGALAPSWFSKKHAVTMALSVGSLNWLAGRALSNRDNKLLEMSHVLLIPLLAPICARFFGMKTTWGQVFRFDGLHFIGSLFSGFIRKTNLDTRLRWGATWLARTPVPSYPTTGEKLSQKGLKTMLPELKLEEYPDVEDFALLELFQELEWDSESPEAAITHATQLIPEGSSDPVAATARKFFRNIYQGLRKLPPEDQKNMLVQLGVAMKACGSQWNLALESICRRILRGENATISDRTAEYNHELKKRALVDSSVRIGGYEYTDVHKTEALRAVFREEFGIRPAGVGASTENSEALLEMQERALGMGDTFKGMGAKAQKRLAPYKYYFRTAFSRQYTADMLVAKHLDYWNTIEGTDIHSSLRTFLTTNLSPPEGVSKEGIMNYAFLEPGTYKWTQDGIIFMLKKTGDLEDDGRILSGVDNDRLAGKLTELERAHDNAKI